MDGATATEKDIPQLASNWKYTLGDFDGNGRADLFWSNSDTGENMIWSVDDQGNPISNNTTTTPKGWTTY
jgi:hypothetical protein